jgi:hypothetical protein
MRRPFLILAAAILVGAALAAGGFRLGDHLCATRMAPSTDDLAWLRMEFRLTDQEMARIRQLHEGYLPQCHGICARIAASKRELHEALGPGTNVSAEVEARLKEIALLRAQCQTAMLRHFVEVSRAMPPEQGRRYLAEMQRLTLGAHESIEDSMSSPKSSPHDHH